MRQDIVVGFALAAVVWTAAHGALIWYVLRHGLIVRGWRILVFLAAVALTSVGVAALVLLLVIPEQLTPEVARNAMGFSSLYALGMAHLPLSAFRVRSR